MAKKVIEIIDLDCTIPVPCVKNRDEMKKLEKSNEDCFVLEFDPDDFSKLSISQQNADDDLILLSQKGEVACRDFPHPRHECARFPFRTTSQDTHCEHCYCYVCDLPAPCNMWVGNYNHCLAFDDERWNTIRTLTREASKSQKQCYCYICEVPAPCEKWVGSGMASHRHAVSNKSWRSRRRLKRKARNLQKKEQMAKEVIEIDCCWPSEKNYSIIPVPCVTNIDEMKKLEKANEDCFILEFDPDDAADLDFSKLSFSEQNADDDFILLAHKGKVACRDFPHPRHACARFPFRTTSQDSHCEHCYCYVCDLPAPCKMWVGNYNHCLAFDDERWNTIRTLTREANKLQKKEDACRPHRRHECVKFPFMTTSHKSHCDLCYCYVCEVPAPCEKWVGKGIYSHRHADKSWRIQRALKRKARNFQEKVECADLRHPRHECEIFPFRITSSKSHCKFCYCYVCDVPAPCEMWVGNYYHCYAFDNERWNTIKKSTRQSIDGVKEPEPGGLM